MSEPTIHYDASAAAETDADERHRLLADEQRRAVVDALAERTAPVPLVELAAAVARATADPAGRDGTIDAETVRIRLHHVHLPLFEELGLLAYDREEGRVERFDAASALRT